MKRATVYLIIAILAASSFTAGAAYYVNTIANKNAQKPFYVGVAYTGNTTAGAKLLIDRVKGYTNLFVLQSGPLQDNPNAMVEICDYAANANLSIIVYFGSYQSNRQYISALLDSAKDRWGDRFLGIYYGDEPGGKMLDSQVNFQDEETGERITKTWDEISLQKPNGTRIQWCISGFLTGWVSVFNEGSNWEEHSSVDYFPDGTILHSTQDGQTVFHPNGTVTFTPNIEPVDGTIVEPPPAQIVTDRGDISQFEPYEELWNSRPLQTCDEVAKMFVAENRKPVDWLRNQSSSKIYTSDYALYWFDFLCGYDVVFAHFGWNNTVAQEVALARGAARLQNKGWGVILTWTYDGPPYLVGGEEMFRQMQTAYESGAEYVVVFNYPAGEDNSYGVLAEEHFVALERFWNEVVPQSRLSEGAVEAEAVLVLPGNHGWGMRSQTDTVWGLFSADSQSSQIWSVLQYRLAMHDLLLDVAYDDPLYPVSGKYSKIYYWNQTG